MKSLLINIAFGIPTLAAIVLLLRGLHAYFGENLAPAMLGIVLLVGVAILLGAFVRLVLKENNLFTNTRLMKAINRWERN